MVEVYPPRHAERTVLQTVPFYFFEPFFTEYEELFERENGFLRPNVKEVVQHSLDCGNSLHGLYPGPMSSRSYVGSSGISVDCALRSVARNLKGLTGGLLAADIFCLSGLRHMVHLRLFGHT